MLSDEQIRDAFVEWYDRQPVKPFPHHTSYKSFHAGARAIESALSQSTEQGERDGGEVVLWQFRWTNPGNQQDAYSLEKAATWETVEPRDRIQSLDQRLEELRSYRFDGKPCYEVRALRAAMSPHGDGGNPE